MPQFENRPNARRALAAAALMLIAAGPAAAYDELVEKREFVMENFVTEQGETIAEVRIGWEAYGELNAARDNAILIAHFDAGPLGIQRSRRPSFAIQRKAEVDVVGALQRQV